MTVITKITQLLSGDQLKGSEQQKTGAKMLLTKWPVVAFLGLEKQVSSLCEIVTAEDERCSISAPPSSTSCCIYSFPFPAVTLHFSSATGSREYFPTKRMSFIEKCVRFVYIRLLPVNILG